MRALQLYHVSCCLLTFSYLPNSLFHIPVVAVSLNLITHALLCPISSVCSLYSWLCQVTYVLSIHNLSQSFSWPLGHLTVCKVLSPERLVLLFNKLEWTFMSGERQVHRSFPFISGMGTWGTCGFELPRTTQNFHFFNHKP
jgi:hypothetical protein